MKNVSCHSLIIKRKYNYRQFVVKECNISEHLGKEKVRNFQDSPSNSTLDDILITACMR